MESLFYIALYGAYFVFMALLLVGCGLAVAPRVESARWRDWLWAMTVRYALGLSVLSAYVIWLGLAGWIGAATVWAGAIGWGAMGFGRWRAMGKGTPPWRGSQWRARLRAMPLDRRLLTLMVTTALGTLSLNVLIGGLAPDVGQDSMWYHLSVPMQWALTGWAEAMPTVFPSNYPLAMEAVYAALLTLLDEPACSVLGAQSTLAFLWGGVLVGWRARGWIGALTGAALWAPAMGAFFGIAPVGVKNDRMAILTLLCGFVLMVEGLMADRRRDGRRWALAGFLLGTAVASKMVVLAYGGAAVAGCLGAMLFARHEGRMEWRANLRDVLYAGVILGAAGAGAYLPWAIRGCLYGGDPVFPFGGGVFGIRPEYEPALAALRELNAMFPFTVDGLRAAVTSLGAKTRMAFLTRDALIGIIVVAVVAGLIRRDGPRRALAVAWLMCAFVFMMIDQRDEALIRYFSICYPLALFLVVDLFALIWRRADRRWALAFLCLVAAGAYGNYASKQVRWGRMKTMQWEYRPMVTPADVRAFAGRGEMKEAFYLGLGVRASTEPTARVCLADWHYPFYMRRKAVWGGPGVGALTQSVWADWDAERIAAWLKATGVDYVIALNPATVDEWRREERLAILEADGRLVPLPWKDCEDELKDWRLWRVADVIEK